MAVSKKDTLRDHVATIHSAINRLIADISEQESMVTHGDNPNHIKWLTGHLAFTAMLAGKTLGSIEIMPDGWGKLFGRGSESPAKLPTFPPMSEVIAKLHELQGKLLERIDSATDDQLDTKCQIAPGWEDSPINSILFLCAHDFYHAGQMAMIRRQLGRERSFG